MKRSKSENNGLEQMGCLYKELENHCKALTVIRDRIDLDEPGDISEKFICLAMAVLLRNQVKANMQMIKSFVKSMKLDLMESEENK